VDDWEHLLAEPAGSKEARFHRVAWAVAVALVRGGPDGVRVAEVARRARVSRPWVYKYVGRDRAALVAFAVGLFGAAFAAPADGEPPTDVAAWRAGLEAGTRKGLADVLVAPWCVLVYVRWRHAHGPLGDQLRAIEGRGVAELVARMPASIRGPDAVAFATAFTGARVGMLHQWLDPAVRAALGEDRAVASAMGIVDAYLPLGSFSRS
jgi:AcrR family transcriptional regulator